jgi:hypothetical protein
MGEAARRNQVASLEEQARREALIADYVAAEDAFRAFTDRNFGRMCAICARWTLFAARANADAADRRPPTGDRSDVGRRSAVGSAARPAPGPRTGGGPGDPGPAPRTPGGAGTLAGDPGRREEGTGGVEWRLSSWVTNCCNANHALESMSEASLAGIVATREEGRQWWQKVRQAAGAPCRALTEHGCYLRRGRPELCNRYFCEAVRDYLWLIGGAKAGAALAERLDDLQRRWATLYAVYQRAIAGRPADGTGGTGGHSADTEGAATAQAEGRPAGPTARAVRHEADWDGFFRALAAFDRDLARHTRPVTPAEMTGRLFKVTGARGVYEPFWAREVAAIGGRVRDPETADPTAARRHG